MGCAEPCMIFPRLKREDHPRTKHDSAFSHWKILIGPSDWEDHSLGKEGTERYRVHNLPKSCSSSGLYELGIVGALTGLERKATGLNPDYIVVVYIGQADSVRTRLQKYGRFGAHLENGSGLFSDIFSRGYSIVFRWAHMRNKQDAEKTEAQLLATFDYAWNKESNGVRRVDDVLQKLEKISSSTTWLPKFVRRLQTLNHKQVGVNINAIKLLSPDKNSNNFLAQIFKFGRSQARMVSDKSGLNMDNSSVCGLALADGLICERPTVKGRKRCAEHKGMKTRGSIAKLVAEDKSNVQHMGVESGIYSEKNFCSHHHYENFIYDTATDNKTCSPISRVASDNGSPCKKPQVERKPIKEESDIICGVNLGEGFLCERRPMKGRKRCEEHKGMRVMHHKVDDFVGSKLIKKESSIMCGVNLGEGFTCERQPVKGRKRCGEHKGMRIAAHAA